MAKARKAGRTGAGGAGSRRHRFCGTMTNHYWHIERHAPFREAQVRLERQFRERHRRPQEARARSYILPVVVHVVYRTDAENISVAQVRSQIAVLNRDFRAANPDRADTPAPFAGLVADAQVQFRLATVDPKGNPTNGITRTRTARTSFGTNDKVKRTSTGGVDPWPARRYLNIWVCSLGEGLLGYAQFPGGPAATDGVVILNTAFGTTGTAAAPFNLGRTTTHEVGHYLNLRHIWGDTEDCSGGDLVADTPNAETANFGAPAFPHISCANGPNGDLFMNYMDYVDDRAMYMFSRGQVLRMHVALDGPRRILWGG